MGIASQIRFPEEWLDADEVHRLIGAVDDPAIFRRVAVSELKRLVAKSPDCLKLLKDVRSAWVVNGDRYLFLFFGPDEKEDGFYKVSVWAKKMTALYIRLKTVWVELEDDILEAMAYFAAEYFETEWSLRGKIDILDFLIWLEEELDYLGDAKIPSLKKKEKLLKDWQAFLTKLNGRLLETVSKGFAKDNATVSPNEDKDKNKDEDNGCRLNSEPLSSLNQGNDAVWNINYAFPIFSKADNVILEKSTFKEENADVVEAAIKYDAMMACEDLKRKDSKHYCFRRSRLGHMGNRCLNGWNENNTPSDENIRWFNALAPLYDVMSLAKDEAGVKATAKNLRIMAQAVMDKRLLLGFDMAELLLNARIANKRLPKDLSAYLKKQLDDEIHMEDTWLFVEDRDRIADRIRKLWILCMAIRQYKYTAETSYTASLMQKEMKEMLKYDGTKTLRLYCELIATFKWSFIDDVYLAGMLDHLKELAKKVTSDVGILNIASAMVFICKRLGISIFKEEGLDVHPDMAIAADNDKAAGDEAVDILRRHPEWAEAIAECMEQYIMNGKPVEDFCESRGFPLVEFSECFDAFMEQMGKLADVYDKSLKDNPAQKRQEIENLKMRKKDLNAELAEIMDKAAPILHQLNMIDERLKQLDAL